jgi:RimJ/RimL family protein N-acetyltransferase
VTGLPPGTRPAVETVPTGRLILEPLAVDHADVMVAVLADPGLYAFIGGSPPTLDELRDRYRRMVAGPGPERSERWLNWVLRCRDDQRLVGTVQATVTDTPHGRQAAVAWVVGVRDQGQGFAVEAARALVEWLTGRGISTVTAYVHPGHAASRAVARRAGLSPTDEIVDGEVVWRRGAA